jgi:hypothetical protein
MHCRIFFVLLILALHPENAACQRSFLPPVYSTSDDEVLIDYAHPSPNRLVFTAARQNPLSAFRWSDGIVFITDNNGALIRQRAIAHNGDSASFYPAAMFTTDSTVEIIGLDGYSVSNFGYPVVHALRWIKMDTSLNVLGDKRYGLASDNETIHFPYVVRIHGNTYVTYSQRYYYWEQEQMRLFVLRFDKEMNLIKKQQFDPAFYGTNLNVNGGFIYGLSAHEASSTLFIPADIRISPSTDSFLAPDAECVLHKLDTALNLLDTFFIRSFRTTNGYDTFLAGNGVETLPLDEHRVWIGSVFQQTTPSQFLPERVGMSLFNTTTSQYRFGQYAPNYDTSDKQSNVPQSKGIAQDGTGHVYVLGSSNSGDQYTPYDNAIVLVKYDTSGALLWHRFITSGNGYFYPTGVHCDGDSIITILSMRYDHAALWPNVGECDYYVVRVRADNGAPVAIFPVRPKSESVVSVYPNPTTGRLNIDAPTGARAQLYAPDGRLVSSSATGAKHLDLTGLAPGIYFLRVADAAGIVLRAEQVVKVD